MRVRLKRCDAVCGVLHVGAFVNVLCQGDHVCASIFKQAKIAETTFTPLADWSTQPAGSVDLGGVPAGCAQYPCATGQECAYRSYSLFCSPCPAGLVGHDGLRCTQCPPGEQPNSNRTQCVQCTGATYSQFGVSCLPCDIAGGNVVSKDHVMCVPPFRCPKGTSCMINGAWDPVQCKSKSQCTKCPVGAVSIGTAVCTACNDKNNLNKVANADQSACDACSAGEQPNSNRTQCVQCTGATYSQLGVSCLPCDIAGGNVVSKDHVTCVPPFRCPKGTSCMINGAWDPVQCKSKSQCTKCPVGAVSIGTAVCTACNDKNNLNKVANADQSACDACSAGEQPNSNHTQCVQCTGATYSQLGVSCLPCDRGIVESTKTTCTACADGLQPNSLGTTCICMLGRFNRSKDAQCYENDYSTPVPFIRECVPCGELNLVGSAGCVQAQQCDDVDFHVRPGWIQLIRTDGIRSSVFRCNHETSCLDNRCTPGSTGPLCGVCAKDYRRDSSGQCSACGAATWAGAAILALILILGVAALITVDRWYRYFSTLEAIRGYLDELDLQAVTKIVVTTGQIIAAFANVLNLEMPYNFQRLLNLLAIFRFDIMNIVGLGCYVEESYANSLAGNIFLVVTMIMVSVIIAAVQRNKEPSVSKLQQFFQSVDTDGNGLTVDEIVVVVHQVDDSVQRGHVENVFTEADADHSERLSFDEFYTMYTQKSGLGEVLRRARRKRSMDDSLGRLYLLVFLVYPGLTSKIFDIFL
eukprot:COSAG01_NODE_5151_length_4451_cov_74.855699_1_plen_750_part_10